MISNKPRFIVTKRAPKIFSVILIMFILLFNLLVTLTFHVSYASNLESTNHKSVVVLKAILEDQGDPSRWTTLFGPAFEELRNRHPNIDLELNYTTFPYKEARVQMLRSLSNHTPVDLISLDQIWLGEFAQSGLLADLTNDSANWGRQKDWYQSNWDGGIFGDKVYGIWAWTDVRGIWYWKDLLNEAKIDPKSLETWDGYVNAAKKLDAIVNLKGIEAIHLTGASHSPDLWYPYLWMLGGEILKMKPGHPSKGSYWFPAYNSSEGVKALEFLRLQVDSGIKPQKNHYWGLEFLDRKFAVMIEALQHHISERFPIDSPDKKNQFEHKVGFIPMFPIPDRNYQTTTLMGGWEFSIPKTSLNKDLAWELLTILLEPQILAPYLASHSNLPTQISIGEGPYARDLNNTTPYYDELITMLKIARNRPSIPEYPQIAENIRQAIDQVYNGTRTPRQSSR